MIKKGVISSNLKNFEDNVAISSYSLNCTKITFEINGFYCLNFAEFIGIVI